MLWQRTRSIVPDHSAQQKIDEASASIRRFDEVWRGLEWLLARSPEARAHKIVDGRQYWLMVRSGDSLAGTPTVAVVYSFTDDEVFVHGVNVLPVNPDAN